MAICFLLEQLFLCIIVILINSVSTRTDFEKVLKKIQDNPCRSKEGTQYLKEVLNHKKDLEWVDHLSRRYKGIENLLPVSSYGYPLSFQNHSRLFGKRFMTNRGDPYQSHRRHFLNHLPFLSKNVFNNSRRKRELYEKSHLKVTDIDNGLTGVLKLEGYKQDSVGKRMLAKKRKNMRIMKKKRRKKKIVYTRLKHANPSNRPQFVKNKDSSSEKNNVLDVTVDDDSNNNNNNNETDVETQCNDDMVNEPDIINIADLAEQHVVNDNSTEFAPTYPPVTENDTKEKGASLEEVTGPLNNKPEPKAEEPAENVGIIYDIVPVTPNISVEFKNTPTHLDEPVDVNSTPKYKPKQPFQNMKLSYSGMSTITPATILAANIILIYNTVTVPLTQQNSKHVNKKQVHDEETTQQVLNTNSLEDMNHHTAIYKSSGEKLEKKEIVQLLQRSSSPYPVFNPDSPQDMIHNPQYPIASQEKQIIFYGPSEFNEPLVENVLPYKPYKNYLKLETEQPPNIIHFNFDPEKSKHYKDHLRIPQEKQFVISGPTVDVVTAISDPIIENVATPNTDQLYDQVDKIVISPNSMNYNNEPKTQELDKEEPVNENENKVVEMTEDEKRKANIEARKLIDVDREFNERNENVDGDGTVVIDDDNDFNKIDLSDDGWDSILSDTDDTEDNVKLSVRQNGSTQNNLEKYKNVNNANKTTNQAPKRISKREYQLFHSTKVKMDKNKRTDVHRSRKLQAFDNDMDEIEKRYVRDIDYENGEGRKASFTKDDFNRQLGKLKNLFGFGHENNYNEEVINEYQESDDRIGNPPDFDYLDLASDSEDLANRHTNTFRLIPKRTKKLYQPYKRKYNYLNYLHPSRKIPLNMMKRKATKQRQAAEDLEYCKEESTTIITTAAVEVWAEQIDDDDLADDYLQEECSKRNKVPQNQEVVLTDTQGVLSFFDDECNPITTTAKTTLLPTPITTPTTKRTTSTTVQYEDVSAPGKNRAELDAELATSGQVKGPKKEMFAQMEPESTITSTTTKQTTKHYEDKFIEEVKEKCFVSEEKQKCSGMMADEPHYLPQKSVATPATPSTSATTTAATTTSTTPLTTLACPTTTTTTTTCATTTTTTQTTTRKTTTTAPSTPSSATTATGTVTGSVTGTVTGTATVTGTVTGTATATNNATTATNDTSSSNDTTIATTTTECSIIKRYPIKQLYKFRYANGNQRKQLHDRSFNNLNNNYKENDVGKAANIEYTNYSINKFSKRNNERNVKRRRMKKAKAIRMRRSNDLNNYPSLRHKAYSDKLRTYQKLKNNKKHQHLSSFLNNNNNINNNNKENFRLPGKLSVKDSQGKRPKINRNIHGDTEDAKCVDKKKKTNKAETIRGELTAKIVGNIFNEIEKCNNMKKNICPALEYKHKYPNPIPGLEEFHNEEVKHDVKNLKDMLHDIMKSINKIIEKEVKIKTCSHIDPDSLNFLMTITQSCATSSPLDCAQEVNCNDVTLAPVGDELDVDHPPKQNDVLFYRETKKEIAQPVVIATTRVTAFTTMSNIVTPSAITLHTNEPPNVTEGTPVCEEEETGTESETANDDTLNDETSNEETLNDEALSDETINEDTMNDETLTDETPNEETCSKETMSTEESCSEEKLNNKKLDEDISCVEPQKEMLSKKPSGKVGSGETTSHLLDSVTNSNNNDNNNINSSPIIQTGNQKAGFSSVYHKSKKPKEENLFEDLENPYDVEELLKAKDSNDDDTQETLNIITEKKQKIRKLMDDYLDLSPADRQHMRQIYRYLHSQNIFLDRVERELQKVRMSIIKRHHFYSPKSRRRKLTNNNSLWNYVLNLYPKRRTARQRLAKLLKNHEIWTERKSKAEIKKKAMLPSSANEFEKLEKRGLSFRNKREAMEKLKRFLRGDKDKNKLDEWMADVSEEPLVFNFS